MDNLKINFKIQIFGGPRVIQVKIGLFPILNMLNLTPPTQPSETYLMEYYDLQILKFHQVYLLRYLLLKLKKDL